MKLKQTILDYAQLVGGAGIIILLDQWTKGLVRANLAIGEVYRPELWLSQYARILHWKNTGAAFGIFQNFGGVFMVLSIVVSIAILFYFTQVPRQERLIRLAMVLQLGGAIGNLIDRLTLGHVTDFISLGNFAVFNVADGCISTGVAVLVLALFLKDREEEKLAQQSSLSQEAQTTQQNFPENPENSL